MSRIRTPRRARGEHEPPLTADEQAAIDEKRSAFAQADGLRARATWCRSEASRLRTALEALGGPIPRGVLEFEAWAEQCERDAVKLERDSLRAPKGGKAFQERRTTRESALRAELAGAYIVAYAVARNSAGRVCTFDDLPIEVRERVCAACAVSVGAWPSGAGYPNSETLALVHPRAAHAFDSWAEAGLKESVEKGFPTGCGIGAAARLLNCSASSVWKARCLTRSPYQLAVDIARRLDWEWEHARRREMYEPIELDALRAADAFDAAARDMDESSPVEAHQDRLQARSIRASVEARFSTRVQAPVGPFFEALQRSGTRR